jgi:hypothetical protein
MKGCQIAVHKPGSGAKCGAVMEQSGRNRWQPSASAQSSKTASQARIVAVACDQLPIGAHGKEGVDGSSPSEGFANFLVISSFCSL